MKWRHVSYHWEKTKTRFILFQAPRSRKEICAKTAWKLGRDGDFSHARFFLGSVSSLACLDTRAHRDTQGWRLSLAFSGSPRFALLHWLGTWYGRAKVKRTIPVTYCPSVSLLVYYTFLCLAQLRITTSLKTNVFDINSVRAPQIFPWSFIPQYPHSNSPDEFPHISLQN